jgi:hypothetical protein
MLINQSLLRYTVKYGYFLVKISALIIEPSNEYFTVLNFKLKVAKSDWDYCTSNLLNVNSQN